MLELRHVSIHYGKRQAVSELSLQVQAGEIVTLVGGNGAGKTTTLKAISGLLPLSGGQIWWDGERIDGLGSHQILAKGGGTRSRRSLALQRHDRVGASATGQSAFAVRGTGIS